MIPFPHGVLSLHRYRTFPVAARTRPAVPLPRGRRRDAHRFEGLARIREKHAPDLIQDWMSRNPEGELINPQALADVRFRARYGLKSYVVPNPKSANSGLMRRRRLPLFDHLVDIGELLGQPRFAKTLNHQLRIY